MKTRDPTSLQRVVYSFPAAGQLFFLTPTHLPQINSGALKITTDVPLAGLRWQQISTNMLLGGTDLLRAGLAVLQFSTNSQHISTGQQQFGFAVQHVGLAVLRIGSDEQQIGKDLL